MNFSEAVAWVIIFGLIAFFGGWLLLIGLVAAPFVLLVLAAAFAVWALVNFGEELATLLLVLLGGGLALLLLGLFGIAVLTVMTDRRDRKRAAEPPLLGALAFQQHREHVAEGVFHQDCLRCRDPKGFQPQA